LRKLLKTELKILSAKPTAATVEINNAISRYMGGKKLLKSFDEFTNTFFLKKQE
jgi:hypothetical protein